MTTRLAGLAFALSLLATLAGCSNYERPAEVAAAEKLVPREVDYDLHVRPILSNNCFRCHGNDAGTREAGLRLDTAEGAYAALKDSKSKHAVVPGKPGKSELFHRIVSTDPDFRMPPKQAHKVLTPLEIATLERWIKQGAKYKPHWAYQLPKEVRPKGSPWDKRAVNPIDRYVFARLDAEGLQPSPEADRETLINRVTLSLTGLPPSLAEVDAFVADKRPDAYERLVDRLLASPRYGENMASTWMDVARYSESDGFLDDGHNRYFIPWRDWAISAFNRNMPYDRFVTWQLAGDQLPNPTREQVLATAFGRLGKRSTENGIIDEEYRVEYSMERTELIGKAFLGLTVGCARCHDHKYDAISQAEYYSMRGFFNSIDEGGLFPLATTGLTQGPTQDWPTAEQSRALTAAGAEVKAKTAAWLAARNLAARDAEAKADALLKQPPEAAAAFVKAGLSKATAAYYPLDASYKGSLDQFKVFRPAAPAGKLAVPDAQTPMGRPTPAAAAGGELIKTSAPAAAPARKPAPTLPMGLAEKDIVLSASGVPGVGPAGLERPRFIDGVKGKAFLVNDNRGFFAQGVGWYERNHDFSLDLWLKLPKGKVYTDATVVNHQDHTVWTADSGYTLQLENNRLKFDLIHVSPFNMLSVIAKAPLPAETWAHVTVAYDGSSRAAGVKLYVDGAEIPVEVRKDNLTRTAVPSLFGGLLQGDFYGFSFGKRFRAEEATGIALDEIRIYDRGLTPLEVKVAHAGALPAGPALRQQLAALFLAEDPRVIAAKVALRDAREAENKIASRIPQLMVMKDRPTPRPSFILDRGLYNKPTKPVQPEAIASVLPWSKELPRNRLGLAKWMFDEKNPLTARVFVNRVWDHHFGAGIVGTVEDFGTQGSAPTHRELLDWLAVEFVRSGWDIKHLNKLIVMSATYRQSSATSPALIEKDPGNMLLARGPRFRMPAEMIRDNALVASGLMLGQIGGRSAYPYQPKGVWEATSPQSIYPEGLPADQNHRRSMYTFIKRNAPSPNMTVFDFADRNVSTVKRRVSNTPLQALVLLNDPQFVEAYRALAERALKTEADPDRQIALVFRLATRRRPIADEMALLKTYRAAQAARFRARPADVKQLLAVGSTPADPALPPVEVAAMTLVTAAVLNSPDAFSIR